MKKTKIIFALLSVFTICASGYAQDTFKQAGLNCSGFYGNGQEIDWAVSSGDFKRYDAKTSATLKDGRELSMEATEVAKGVLLVQIDVTKKGQRNDFRWVGSSVTLAADGTELTGEISADTEGFSFNCFADHF